ncbi:hypothetical protein FS837_008320 [Tulasnella sp. UAMH 9824]|nr:hypothetical protein FS837_008320 [Tulasnella sp. UAMH 9824]
MAQEFGKTVTEAEQNLAISDGRVFQKTNDAYKLPTDVNEHSRLDLQHEAIRIMLGGELYQAPELVKAALSPEASTKRRVLDMAEEFPHADILGTDLVEPNILRDPTYRVPPNCSFQIADANKDMKKVDSVYDMKLLDEKGKYIPLQKPGNVGYSHFQHLVSCFTEVHLKGGNLRLQHPFWRSMLEINPHYSYVQVKEVLVPTGPWSNNLNGTERKLAEIMQANLLQLLTAWKASILHSKLFPEEFVHQLAENAMKEIRELPQVVQRYNKCVFVMAVRNENAWTARKCPWQEPPGYDVYEYVIRPLPNE